MDIIIDRIAIWQAKPTEGFTIREVPIGTRYRDHNNVYVISDKLMFRYAKNYKVGKTNFCLFARTFRDDESAIESELDKVAKTIDEAYAKKVEAEATLSKFEYTNSYLKGAR